MDDPLIENIPPSCTHCRRKKSKCNREKPVCSNCQKTGQICSYEKVTRTPLTRRHLTAVEEELNKTKALLQQYKNGSTTPRVSLNDSETISARPSTNHETPDSPLNPRYDITRSHIPSQEVSRDLPSVSTHFRQHVQSASVTAKSRGNGSQLETPPAGEFDWDERAGASHAARFVDGMASLADNSNKSGYLGVASGAALVRLADSGSADAAFDLDLAGQEDSRQTTPPLFVTIYPASQLEPYIDSYFQTYHCHYPIVHEATFRAQFMEVIPRPKGSSWQVLLHVIATLGCFSASEVPPEADLALFEATKQRMSIDMLETGNIALVQALTLMSNYIQKRNRPNSGYNYMGLAKRMAYGLGLHKEFPTWHNKILQMESRRRVWWCLFIFDVGAIITFSRPLDVPQHGIEVALPLNVSDIDITMSTTDPPSEAMMTTLYTHLRCQATFHLATADIYERLISSTTEPAEMIELETLHLDSWRQSLPPWFQDSATQVRRYRLPHAILHWRWRNFKILMYRPYLIRSCVSRSTSDDENTEANDLEDDLENATQRCLNTALESVQMISSFWLNEKQNCLTCWYGLYFLFQAILIPAVCLRNRTRSEQASAWREVITFGLSTIADMERLNSAAARCHATVMKLCGPHLTGDSPTHESPQTQLNSLYSMMFGPMADGQFGDLYDFALQDPMQYDFMNELGAP